MRSPTQPIGCSQLTSDPRGPSKLTAPPQSPELDEALLKLVRAALFASLALRRTQWSRLPQEVRDELDALVRAAEQYSVTFCAVTGERPPVGRAK